MLLRRNLSRLVDLQESNRSALETTAREACQKAQRTGKPEDHQAAVAAHEAVASSIADWLDKRGGQYSAKMGAHGECAISHKQRIKGNVQKIDLGGFMFSNGRQSESVATTYYHEFYGNRTGINNRIPICPDCNLPVNESFGPRHPMASGLSALHCQCERSANATN